MIEEVQCVVKFLSDMLRNSVTQDQVDAFHQNLMDELPNHYLNHWFPENPSKGSAYRCIRINQTSRMDNLLIRVANRSGLSETTLLNALPRELTLWVDPHEVSCRFGEDGSIGMIYEASPCNSESEDSDSSSDSGVRSGSDDSSCSSGSDDSSCSSGSDDSSCSNSFLSESESAYSPKRSNLNSRFVASFFARI